MQLLVVAQLENRVAEVTYMMRVHGINFDTKFWTDMADGNVKRYEEEIEVLNWMTDNKVKNWGSPKQILNYFNNVEGLEINSMTEFHSFEDDNPWRGKCDSLDQLIKIRIEIFKYATTYGYTWLETRYSKEEPQEPTVGPDGRIHCDFQQIINTGRFSCSKPNLQQIPNNWQDNPLHDQRKAFIPTEGFKFVSADFSGQELSLMAVGSQEENWIKIIQSGEDLHSQMAALIYGEKWEEAAEEDCTFKSHKQKCECPIHKRLRQSAKTIDFGLPYGKGFKTIANDLGITIEEARTLVGKFNKAAPKLIRWLDKNGKDAARYNEAYTLKPFRRRRSLILEDMSWRKNNMGKNTPIQGSGGDMIKLAMWMVFEYIELHNYPAKILLCIHDELLTEVREDKAEEWSGILKDLMEKAALKITKIKLIEAEPQITDYWKK